MVSKANELKKHVDNNGQKHINQYMIKEKIA